MDGPNQIADVPIVLTRWDAWLCGGDGVAATAKGPRAWTGGTSRRRSRQEGCRVVIVLVNG